MNKPFYCIFLLLLIFSSSVTNAQKAWRFDLGKLLSENKFVASDPKGISALSDAGKHGVVCKNGIYWIKDADISNGSIEVDMKGRDVFQQSFLGIAFHGVDTVTYDLIYLRPFNFQSTDSLRKNHAIQYISSPDYSWERLRKEHPLMYEQPVAASVLAEEWVHVRIVVYDGEITVYLNNSPQAALKVKKLNDRNDGLLGLWCSGSADADFANLVIKKNG